MLDKGEILSKIKSLVKDEIPDAKVYLFGSRATGKVHEESDWDILILTSGKVDKSLKKKVHYKLSSISLKINDFIDCTFVNQKDWNEAPSFYVLRHSIQDEAIRI